MSEMIVSGCVTGILDLAESCHDKIMEIAALKPESERSSAVSDLVNSLVCQTKASFCELAQEKGLSPAEMHRRYGLDTAYASRMINGMNPIPAYVMAAICYDLLHISCHELVFGEPARIIIPTPLSAAVRSLVETDAFEDRAELQRFLSGYVPETVPQRVSREFLNDRLEEICDDLGLSLRTVLNDNPWYPSLLCPFHIRPGYFEGVVPSVKRLIRFSMSWRRPLDWFLARDYTPYAQLYYRDGDGISPLPNRFRTLVSMYLRLSAEDQVRMLAELLSWEAAA